jgi:hypothetical protein
MCIYLYFINQKTNNMKKAFRIYKENVTNGWITILIPLSEFNEQILEFKVNKYLSLNYQVEIL